jgi:NTP pyrophosphatase (non-canonical NTP hydrolase)
LNGEVFVPNDDTSDPSLGDLQAAVDDWITQWDEGYWPPLSNLARLTEEVGELARLLNRVYGAKVPKSGDEADDHEAIRRELGDILFVVITLANDLDIDLGEVLTETLDKYEIRDADRWTPRSDDAD